MLWLVSFLLNGCISLKKCVTFKVVTIQGVENKVTVSVAMASMCSQTNVCSNNNSYNIFIYETLLGQVTTNLWCPWHYLCAPNTLTRPVLIFILFFHYKNCAFILLYTFNFNTFIFFPRILCIIDYSISA